MKKNLVNAIALEPCPFCGEAPEIEKEIIMFPNSRNNSWCVVCRTEDCPAANAVQDGEMGGFVYSWPKDEAIERWNRRGNRKGAIA